MFYAIGVPLVCHCCSTVQMYDNARTKCTIPLQWLHSALTKHAMTRAFKHQQNSETSVPLFFAWNVMHICFSVCAFVTRIVELLIGRCTGLTLECHTIGFIIVNNTIGSGINNIYLYIQNTVIYCINTMH